ncbi:hypothetical protein RYX56_05545 [Alkalihalophilus lindianensis]|uniref:Uncharacterized protein n=1 Tax=Alkalihalophilus lindianensis TaxID=1630542 RepID=A0ABU3X7B7_9BACI|nr:hypothetical protein [Alkalihalophilus lindianensis]MDV2683772.1 hypothetical protein [Alkalihalophilus lindianensis]MDV2683838.1 hypothetical protein [Alkalihalophilus lindianensis]
MKLSEMLKALEDGKRVRNTAWPTDHFWEMESARIVSVGDGKKMYPKYHLNDLFDYGCWEVVPKYVSFTDAMKAFEQGKQVAISISGHYVTFNKADKVQLKHNFIGEFTFRELVENKWVIEE